MSFSCASRTTRIIKVYRVPACKSSSGERENSTSSAPKKMKKKLDGHSHLTAEKTPEGHEAVPTSADEMRRLSRLRLALKVGRASFSMQSGPWAVPGYRGTCATFLSSAPLSLSFTKQKMSYDLDLAYGRRDASSGSALPHSLPSLFLSLSLSARLVCIF